MEAAKRLGHVLACALACALAVAIAAAAGPAVARAIELAPVSAIATPSVPVSVTHGRTFTVTGTVEPGRPEALELVTYRLLAGEWVREGSVAASITTPATGAQYAARITLEPAGTWVVRAESTGAAEPSFSSTSSEIRVSDRADAVVWNRDGVLTIPERMAYRSDARQLLVVTAKSVTSHTGTLRVYEYRRATGDWVKLFASPCRLGRNGLCGGEERRRGNAKTPTGIWRMPGFVFGQHAKAPAGTLLPYRHVTKFHWWSAEKGSHYNEWVWSRRRVDGEHLIDYRVTYEYAVSTGYNAEPNTSVFGRGTGIFLHCWLGKTTSGCVSVPRETMQQVFATLSPGKRRVFVVGTTGEGDPTSVFAY